MNRRTLLIATAALASLALSMPVEAQFTPNADCILAKTWHLQQAMKFNLRPQQEFHLGAADAADQLSTMGGQPCSGWQGWATGGFPSQP